MPAWVSPKERTTWVISSRKALLYGIRTALLAGAVMGSLAFFAGDLLASLFSGDSQVIAYAHDYLKAYAIDCLLTAVLFCFVGYFNGCSHTVFVMVQGVVGAFCVRIPVVYLMSRIPEVRLFQIGLGTPISSAVQILLCIAAYRWYQNRAKRSPNKTEKPGRCEREILFAPARLLVCY